MKKTLFTRKHLHLTLGFVFSCFNLFAFQNCKQDYSAVQLESVANVVTSVPTVPVYANISIISAPPLFKTSAVSFSFDVEIGSGDSLKTVRCQIGSAAAVDCSSKTVSFNALADGQHQLTINVETTKGAVANQSVTFIKDTTAPVIMVTQAPASVTGSTSASFVFAAMDNLIGQIQIQCSLNNTAFTNCASPLSINNLVAGTHNMKIRATDVAGHVSAVYNYNWTINLTAPTISITSMVSSFTNSSSQSISFTGSGVVSFECQLDGGAYAACTSPKAYTGLSSSAHTFNVRGITAQATATSPVAVSWTVDTVAPVKPVLVADIGVTTTSTAATMTFSSSDAGSGLASFQCSLDSAAYATCVSPLALSNLVDGVHTFNVRAYDKVGNVSVVSTFSFTVTKPDPLALFNSAKTILTNRCNSCHSTGGPNGATSFALATEKEFINNGLVVPGDIANSKIIYRLKNYTVDNGLRNMPPGTALTAQEYTTLVNWVNGLPQETVSNQFACAINEEPLQQDAKRLSRVEYTNSIKSLLDRAVPANSAAIMALLKIDQIFPQDATNGYSTGDNNFSLNHARSYFDVADIVSTQLTNSANYTNFVNTYLNYNKGTCTFTTVTALNADCTNTLIRNFTLRAWGRPIEENTLNLNNEFAALQSEFNYGFATTVAVGNMIFRVLTAPQFLFHIQKDVSLESGLTYKLSSYSIARKLSFMYNHSLPDENLLTIAKNNDLNQDAGFNLALNAVAPKMSGMVSQFSKEWLRLDKLPQFANVNDPKFKYITSQKGIIANEGLRSGMVSEIQELMTYLSSNNRSYKEIFTSNISFARNPELMKVYGQTTAVPATVTEANAVRFPAGERSGILTRAALLFSGAGSENPIMRGIHIRKDVLCLKLSDPPANLGDALSAPPLDPNLTTRERYQVKTSQEACIGCHSQINPVGFSLSKYNALGSFQPLEPIFDINGNKINDLATDARANLSIPLGINKEVQSGVEFSTEVADSKQFKKCFTQNFYSYAYGLNERTAVVDSCTMNKMYSELDNGATLQSFFKSAALDPNFRKRKIVK